MYPFSYDVVCYNDIDSGYIRESGVSFCENWMHAMEIIAKYYSDDLIEVKSLILYEENSTILLPRSVIKQYLEEPETFFDNGSHYPCDKYGNAVSVEPIGKGEVAELTPIEKNVSAVLLNKDGSVKKSIDFEPIPFKKED